MIGELLFTPAAYALAIGLGAAAVALLYVIWWALTEYRRHEGSHAE